MLSFFFCVSKISSVGTKALYLFTKAAYYCPSSSDNADKRIAFDRIAPCCHNHDQTLNDAFTYCIVYIGKADI